MSLSVKFDAVGTVLAYVMYWLAVIVTLIWIKFKEVSRTLVSSCLFPELTLYPLGSHEVVWV